MFILYKILFINEVISEIMKDKILLTGLMCLFSACSSVQSNDDQHLKTGLANPASQYCIDQGGQHSIVNEQQGQVGYCLLENGEKVEEWSFYRQTQLDCRANDAEKLVGKILMSEQNIKQLTGAKVVRQVTPNQMVTMDYHNDRVTITYEPSSKKIIRASCG